MRLRGNFSGFVALTVFAAAAWGGQMRQIAIVDIPGRPGFDQVVFARGMLVMAHTAGDTLDIFDPAKRRMVAQVQGMSDPHGLAVDARGEKVYVANSGGKNIAVVSSKDWKLERTISLDSTPCDLMLSPDSRRLWVGNRENRSISAVDLAGGDKVVSEDLNGSPAGLAFDSARRTILASLQDTAEVAAINPDTLNVVRRYKLAASQPTGIVVDEPARRLYVAVRHAIVSLDVDSGRELGRAAAPAGADSLWLDSSAHILYVASGGGYISTFRTGGSNLTPIDELRTDVRGRSVAFDPARQFVFVPGGREGRSKLLILKQLGSPITPQSVQQAAQTVASSK
jgi:DNA-binding beta-propeller fold protein YncE